MNVSTSLQKSVARCKGTFQAVFANQVAALTPKLGRLTPELPALNTEARTIQIAQYPPYFFVLSPKVIDLIADDSTTWENILLKSSNGIWLT